MNKRVLILLITVLVFIFGNVTTAFADAATFDVENAGYYVYVATPDGGLNMRQGPGTDYSKVMQKRIPDDTKLYVEIVSDGWGYVEYNGNTGWVSLKQTTTTKPSVKKSYEKHEADYYVYVATPDDGLNMRQGPGADYKKVMSEAIPDNTELYIEYISGNWGYTSYNGNKGWVSLAYTTTSPVVITPQPDDSEAEENTDASLPNESEKQEDTTIKDTQDQNTVEVQNEETEKPESFEMQGQGMNGQGMNGQGMNASTTAKKTISTQVLLIALLLLLIIMIALLVLVWINMK